MARRKKQDEEQSPENVNQNSDDTFGLPEIEYKPLNREEAPATPADSYTQSTSQTETPMEREEVEQTEYNSNAYYTNDEDEQGSPWPKILGIILVLILAGGAVWYFAMYRPKQLAAAAEKARIEQE